MQSLVGFLSQPSDHFVGTHGLSPRRTGHGLIPISGRPRRWRSWWRRPMKKAWNSWIHWYVRYIWHITIESDRIYIYILLIFRAYKCTIYIFKISYLKYSSNGFVHLLFLAPRKPAIRDQRQEAFRSLNGSQTHQRESFGIQNRWACWPWVWIASQVLANFHLS